MTTSKDKEKEEDREEATEVATPAAENRTTTAAVAAAAAAHHLHSILIFSTSAVTIPLAFTVTCWVTCTRSLFPFP